MRRHFLFHNSFAQRFISILVVGMLTIIPVMVFTPRDADALTARDFNYGRIIDDSVFYNKDAMNVQQIQNFLNRIMPSCDTWGTWPSGYGNLNNAQYAQQIKGWPGPPYVCINNYHENPNTGETSFEKGGGAFAGGLSAAQIIYDAAQQYGINPQVLLVLLKKESVGPLTADKWPLKSQYKYAMGYACPDSGPGYSANCAPQKAGFYKQVTLAAWQLKYYRDHPNDYRYKIGLNNIQYSPDPSCGTRQVNIENISTLSLYIYTPYVPNPGALANYPGTAPCGAYGNRNFFMFFSEWFGSTYGNHQIDMLKADQDITAAYNSFKSQLGLPITDKIPEFNSSIRVWQNFERGTIIWTHEYGAYPVLSGDLYDRWRALGGSTGSLGVPIGSSTTETDDGRIWQKFKNGIIIDSQEHGAWEILNGPLSDKWRSVGGSLGLLGRPTSGVIIESSGNRKQNFENGTVIRQNINTPAYILTGIIKNTWEENKSVLGAPTTDSTTETDDGRIWQNFEKGVVIQNTQNDAWIIRSGNFYNKWKALGGSKGKLGKPTSNQSVESDGRIWQNFEKGVVIQKASKYPAYEILFGSIYDRWQLIGGSLGELGTPQGSPTTESDGRIWQNFEKGVVVWSQGTGAWDVQSNFYNFWKQHGGSLGELGKPIGSKQIDLDDTRWQNFEKGKAIWKNTIGWSIEAS